ncbi:MAG: peptidoglycan-associated lipoprotein Pal [Candidatus Hydrogenedens sp.]|nr:peptidoglycan-associated lipoprotein Pal [Candidatus Hydrogenedens sp.]
MLRIGLRMFSTALVAVLLLGGMSGCKSKKQEPLAPAFDDSANRGMESTSNEGLNTNLDLSRLPFVKADDLEVVYFDYDSSSLRADGLAAISRNADRMKARPEYVFQIAGHCDERGTQEYNIALGERRALAVRDHLIKLGVSGDRIITISYGEEMPAVMGSGESAWAKNRRAEFLQALPR